MGQVKKNVATEKYWIWFITSVTMPYTCYSLYYGVEVYQRHMILGHFVTLESYSIGAEGKAKINEAGGGDNFFLPLCHTLAPFFSDLTLGAPSRLAPVFTVS